MGKTIIGCILLCLFYNYSIWLLAAAAAAAAAIALAVFSHSFSRQAIRVLHTFCVPYVTKLYKKYCLPASQACLPACCCTQTHKCAHTTHSLIV